MGYNEDEAMAHVMLFIHLLRQFGLPLVLTTTQEGRDFKTLDYGEKVFVV